MSKRIGIFSAFSASFLCALAAPAAAQSDQRVAVPLSDPSRPARLEISIFSGDIEIEGYDGNEVIVVADAPIAREATASLGTVVENEQVARLPLNGRLFITLATIAPGVALPPNSVLPRINGGRPRTNEYLFDGISVLQPEPGQVAFYPIIDAIQEFKIESNSPPAEFGRFNGGVVNLTTKSGANAVHGSMFEFFRGEALNARNYFQRSNPEKPQYSRNQFGGVLGGPVARDRTFYFVDYQGQRQSIARTVTSTVPTLLQRQGIFTEAIGGRVTFIGDSIMQGAAPMIEDILGADIYIDAARKRKMEDVPTLVQKLSREGHLSHVVVIHLGSNRPFEAPVFDSVMKALLAHDVKRVIFINVHRPIGWEYYINQKFAEGVTRWQEAELIDWDAMAHSTQEWFIRDQTHLSYAGSEAYVNVIRETLNQDE